MSISSHLGIVILVIVGAVTVLGVIIAAIIETKRMDREKPSVPQQPAVTPTDPPRRIAAGEVSPKADKKRG
jgi:hypothetical protein